MGGQVDDAPARGGKCGTAACVMFSTLPMFASTTRCTSAASMLPKELESNTPALLTRIE